MKIYIKASASIPSLKEYVGLPFDLSNDEVQYKIAYWAAETLVDTLKQTRGCKRRKFFIDDLSWSSTRIYFQVYEELKGKEFPEYPCWDFNSRLNFYDGAADDYEDVESIIYDNIRDFIYMVR